MITKEQYENASKMKDDAEKIINQYFKEQQNNFDERIKNNPIFTDDELIYSATILCPCGYGLAYPKGCGPFHYWDCSAVLKGIDDKSKPHCGRLPFLTYQIECEGQPSAMRNTTRGVCDQKLKG